MSSSYFNHGSLQEADGTANGREAATAAPFLVTSTPDVNLDDLSIALIGPDEEYRACAAQVVADSCGADVQEYSRYPQLYELPRLLEERYDVIILDLDSDPGVALELVASLGSRVETTVMVYSAQTEPELLVRCMQAGAREFLNVPFRNGALEQALVRASARRPKAATHAVRAGRVHVFMGSKGGVGVTSIACNFAVALAQERDQKTILIDLDLPLGDAALILGVASEFSTVSALQASDRLDGAFLARLLVKHKSGLRVLAAPGRFPHFEPSSEAIERLLAVARREFDNIVIDVGSRLDLTGTAMHREASIVYLVTQAGIPELRNANRLINQVFTGDKPRLEIVLNRFHSRTIGLSEKHINEALTRAVQWRVPNDHGLVRKMQVDASPLVLTDNPLARTIRQMAEAAIGKTPEPEAVKKKQKRGFFSGK